MKGMDESPCLPCTDIVTLAISRRGEQQNEAKHTILRGTLRREGGGMEEGAPRTTELNTLV